VTFAFEDVTPAEAQAFKNDFLSAKATVEAYLTETNLCPLFAGPVPKHPLLGRVFS
jgi:hypothetical protein